MNWSGAPRARVARGQCQTRKSVKYEPRMTQNSSASTRTSVLHRFTCYFEWCKKKPGDRGHAWTWWPTLIGGAVSMCLFVFYPHNWMLSWGKWPADCVLLVAQLCPNPHVLSVTLSLGLVGMSQFRLPIGPISMLSMYMHVYPNIYINIIIS